MEVVRVHKVRLETERLVLRELQEKDAIHLANGLAPIEVSQYLVRVPHPYNVSDALGFINKTKLMQETENREGYPLAITLKDGSCLA